MSGACSKSVHKKAELAPSFLISQRMGVEDLANEQKLLLARTEDLYTLCDKYCCPRFSTFLDEAQQQDIMENIGQRSGYSSGFFGGYPAAQRKIFGVFPEWFTYSEADFLIKVLKFTKSYGETLTHRDYLGTILSLGIDRAKTGDILVDGDTAYVFVAEDIAEFIRDQVTKVANRGVKIEIIPCGEAVIPEQKFEEIKAVAASLRLDAVIAAILNLSRNTAGKLVEAGRVSVNHRAAAETAKGLAEGDVLSVKGYGRFILSQVGGKTRSERLHVIIKKYI